MSFIRSTRLHQYKVGEAAYISINALLPIALLLLTNGFNSLYPALALVLLSKWRIIALRPRFWWMSIKANAVDLLFGISIAILLSMLHSPTPQLVAQVVVVLCYEVWLLYLKPRSDTLSVILQAGIAQFLALVVLFNLSADLNDFLVLLGCWVIGYSAARHVLGVYNEELIDLLSSFWALLLAQFGWLLYHWTLAYDIGLTIKIPQIALLILVLSFTLTRLYAAAKNDQLKDIAVRLSALFSVGLLLVIIIFSHWDVTI
ncbi:MAG TPA: hypothetical protein VNG90_02750 [Candidatus Acidoferrum sp.]|nr:hypothetical protein [Candidatus Acidoferrum sp.]